jgi:hypothetical protein
MAADTAFQLKSRKPTLANLTASRTHAKTSTLKATAAATEAESAAGLGKEKLTWK